MILAAALLVLVALGLFVGGILTGLTAMYWACVAVSAVAAILLVVARRQLSRPPPTARTRPADPGERAPARREPVRTSMLPVQATSEPAVRQAEPVERVAEPVGREAEPVEPAAAARHASPLEEIAPAGSTAAGAASRHAGVPAGAVGTDDVSASDDVDEPPVEEVEVTDLLLVVDLHDDVLVVDEHPRYHVPGCVFLTGRTGIPLPMDEARTDGFTPCGLCNPDRHMAGIERARRAGRRGP
ncbi:MAG TPA: hypothetical protein VGN28_06460 [Blastococcus sp.]|nr:hypothetical protein [Blastococcus sp.]